MKVLWYVNIVMPDAAKILNCKSENTGGWLSGAAQGLKGTAVELSVMTVTKAVDRMIVAQSDGITYIFLSPKTYLSEFSAVIRDQKPDLVHIFGTEYCYNTQLIHLCKEMQVKSVVSIQGIMRECAAHYDDGLPEKFRRVNPAIKLMRKLYYADSIALEKKRFADQGRLETAALKEADAVIGRTDWDRRTVMGINPKLQYYHVNENLRDTFYEGECWQFERCVPHTIFVSQSFYPIKGFHMLLEAMPELVKRYPDIQVIVGGQKPYTLNNRLLDYGVDYFFEYQKYVKKLIKKYGLVSYIQYTGTLSAEQMREQFLRCNVFLSCSTIENSPNSVAEAMILGVPVVASRVGGTESLLTDQKDGLLFDFADKEALIGAVHEMFESPQKAKMFSVNAREHALRTHDRDQNTAALLKTYEDILRG